MLRAVGSSVSVEEVLPVVADELPVEDEELDPLPDEELVDAVELPDDPLVLAVPVLLPLLDASLSVGGGATYAIERISIANFRIKARANCDRSISSRPREVIFQD